MKPHIYTLDNGIRIVHLPVNSMVAHCGLIIGAGSGNEESIEHGLAHFTEHMFFKGTERRKSYHILSRLEDVGGELNAYTTKEETVVHASVLSDHYERAVELIHDIVFNSTFPAHEIEKEKEVIIEEIKSYRDNPSELIFDDFEGIVFQNHPLGRNILGTPETIKEFRKSSITGFIQKNYSTGRMIFCSAGKMEPGNVFKLAKKYLESIPERSFSKTSTPFTGCSGVTVTRNMGTWQNHCIIGNVAYNIYDRKRLGMFMLNNILGGQGLNSRLNLSLREKNGFAYNIESVYNPYTVTGVFSIYFGTDKDHLEKSIAITHRELRKLKENSLGTLQLSRAKNQIKGYLARGYENHENLMLSMGKSLLVFGKIESLEEVCSKIDSLKAYELHETANEIFHSRLISTLIYK